MTKRDGAARSAHGAHNPEVVGSNPTPATAELDTLREDKRALADARTWAEAELARLTYRRWEDVKSEAHRRGLTDPAEVERIRATMQGVKAGEFD